MDETLRNNLRDAYAKQVASRDSRIIEDWKIEDRARFLKILQTEGKASLLEIGAGTGQDSIFFAKQGLKVTCIDLSPENVASCREKGLDAQVMDMCAIQFSPEIFDAAFALNCLLHLPKSEFPVALEQVSKVLKVDGLFYLGQYGGNASEGVWEEDVYDPPRFFSFFTDEAIQSVVGKTFEVVSFKPIDLGGLGGQLHFQSLILRKHTET
ncbi:MAG: class I SAM-dependent methyltransferase [Chloroflexi bacterium]|nr:MAG: class I SAM-dependent methyltransferase [Chloroflexota bacterium]MBL1195229.1 class I SAM-dependent methyltransferase [Chloroflexota bacterium]NOH12514.1 class I SAM-dependent methyltransferase [Chloroflexota bacterium]